jgi:rhamnosyltransferase subunit B
MQSSPPSSSPRAQALRILLPTLGSAGDVYPMIALGIALRRRAHRVTLITSAYFQPLIEKQGLEFLPVGTMTDFEAAIADPDLWHPRRGFTVVARRVILPAIEPIFRLIERHADANTVVAASSICLGARVAQDKLHVPTASVHLQPSVIRSLVDQGMMGNFRISAAQPLWFKRAFFRLLDWAVIDRELKRPLNDFRASLGLAPVERPFRAWIHSPQCVIGFFPDWFAAAQPDCPPHLHLVGFPLWDGDEDDARLSSEACQFLNSGEAPVIFTPGSAAASMQRYFRESVAAVCKLGVRAMLITNFPGQLPSGLPSNIKPCGYLPFSQVLPRAALLVYHGGIGTLAQTVKAAIPHLVVPNSHDQFDNAWRVEKLGLGRTIPQARYRAAHAANVIQEIIEDDGLRQRCREYAARVDSKSAVTRACELIEGLARAS